jgi:hypothetical protein
MSQVAVAQPDAAGDGVLGLTSQIEAAIGRITLRLIREAEADPEARRPALR